MLPIIEKIAQRDAGTTRALIIVPTRELAIQIEQQVQGFSYYAGTTSCAIYGGGDGKEWDEQRKALEDGVDIVVATPGKLISFIDNEIANLKNIEYVVLDEADRMLDIGFHDDIIRIFSHLPRITSYNVCYTKLLRRKRFRTRASYSWLKNWEDWRRLDVFHQRNLQPANRRS